MAESGRSKFPYKQNQGIHGKYQVFIDDIICQLSHWKNRKYFHRIRNSKEEITLEGFDRLKCIYVHIPKTAGVAINKALYGNLGGSHKTVKIYKRIFGPVTYKKYFKFTFVRNPYSRICSAFTFLKNGGYGERDREWASKNMSDYSTVNEFITNWLNEQSLWSYDHFRPQYSYVCDISDQPEVDFIGKFESIDSDFDRVCDIIGVQNRLAVRNKGVKDHSEWDNSLTAHSKQRISELYRKDFEIFNYQTADS